MLFELLQINNEFLREQTDVRNLELHLNKQSVLAESWAKSTNQQREDDASITYHRERYAISHVPKSIDTGVDSSFNSRLESEVSYLDSQTQDNLNDYKSETDINGLNDDALDNFINRQRVNLTEATTRYDALREQHKELLSKLETIKQNGGDYLAIRDEILKSEATLDEGAAQIIDSREDLNKAAEVLRERMFERGDNLMKIDHPIAESYKEHLIEHELAKAQMLKIIAANGGKTDSHETDIGRLHQRLTVSEKQLSNLESRWDKLKVEIKLVDSEIIINETEFQKESVKLTDADFSNNFTITRRGAQDEAELKTYYRNNTFDNFSVGSRSGGSGPSMNNIEARDQAFAHRQETMLEQAKGQRASDPLKAERIDNARQFEFHEYKAAVSNKLLAMPGVWTSKDADMELFHDKQSGQFAVRLAEIDYKLAEQAQNQNPSLEMPTRLAVLASNVRKSEAIQEVYKEQSLNREIAEAMGKLGYHIGIETTKYSELEENLVELRNRKTELNHELVEVLDKRSDTIKELNVLNTKSLEYADLNPAAKRLADKRAELGITAIPTRDQVTLAQLKSQAMAKSLETEANKQNEQGLAR